MSKIGLWPPRKGHKGMLKSTRHSVWQESQQADLAEQSPENSIRYWLAQCLTLASHYHTTPEVVLDRAWWQSLYQAGVTLRDTLAAHRNHWEKLCLTDKEVEQAHYTLIHVAYFFEPGGVAERVFQQQGWVWSDDEQEA